MYYLHYTLIHLQFLFDYLLLENFKHSEKYCIAGEGQGGGK